MSEMFSVSVVDVTPRAARLWVISVHPDSGPPAPRAVFALMLMFDPILNSGYSAFKSYSHLEDSPLARVMDRDNYLDSRWMQANARGFVAKVKFKASILEIEPTDPAWIEHLRKGMHWDTAAYDGGPGLPTAPRTPAPKGEAVRAQDPAAGFRVGAPKYKEYDVPGAFIPLHGPNNYVADPVLTRPAEMKAAVQTMLGQPLLVVPKRGPKRIGALVELRDEGVMIYYETQFGYGGESVNFDELKSLGRAWFVSEAAPAVDEAAAKPARKTSAKKTAAKKTTVKKAAAKKPAAKKTTAKKPAAKKAAAKRTTAKKTAKKATAKTTSAKKTTAKKAAAKKTAVKKTAAKKTAAKKTAAKKPAATKTTAKKPAAKKPAAKRPTRRGARDE